MQRIAKICRGIDNVLTFAVEILLVAAILFAGYALWDTYMVYQSAMPNEEMLKFKPDLLNSTEGNESLLELMTINADARAWLTIEDTFVDYPIMQGTDNMTYVNTDMYGEFSLSGSIFMDCRNASDFSDFYTLTYGHHMESGAMYGDIEKFRDEEYFLARNYAALYLPDSTWTIELFACLAVDAYDNLVFNPRRDTGDEQTDEAYRRELLTYLKETAVHYREIDVTTQDRIIGMSTCSQASTNARTVVFGRMKQNL
ncbi:MAG: class B sortase [Clostridia bacterium]|nr:class B sortase [Clostridia bacterium]